MLKTKNRCGSFFILWIKITSFACLLGSGLKLIFHWKTHLLIFFRSSFNSVTEAFTSETTENKDKLPAKCFTFWQLTRSLEPSRFYVPLKVMVANFDSWLALEWRRWLNHLRKKMLNVMDLHFSLLGGPTFERE